MTDYRSSKKFNLKKGERGGGCQSVSFSSFIMEA